MHIAIAILGIIGTVAYIVVQLRNASAAAPVVIDAARDVRLYARRSRWRRKVNRDILAHIEDPREAAAAMMVAVAQYDGALTEAEHDAIASLMVTHFEVDRDEANELIARGRWLAQDTANLDSFLHRAAPAIVRACSPNEKADLVAMLGTVAGGGAGEAQLAAISSLRRRLA